MKSIRLQKRKSDWFGCLRQYVNVTRFWAFNWGTNDCGIWALGAVDAMCGSDMKSEFLDKYNSEEGATAFFQERGWKDFDDACTELFGLPMKTPNFAQRGDLLVLGVEDTRPIGTVMVIIDDYASAPGVLKLENNKVEVLHRMHANAYKVGY